MKIIAEAEPMLVTWIDRTVGCEGCGCEFVLDADDRVRESDAGWLVDCPTCGEAAIVPYEEDES